MKQIIGNGDGSWASSYSFDAANKKIVINGFSNLNIEQILLINNITQNVLIYNPFINGVGYTDFSNGIITLEYDTTTHSNSDKLQIFYDNSDEAKSAITDLSIEIKNLLNSIATPLYYDMATGGLRISTGTLPTVTTVTTVSTVTNIGQMGGIVASLSLTTPLMNIAFNQLRDKITTT